MKTGIELIAAKRDKHLTKHGYDAEHDLEHTYMQFINAARAYMYRDVHFWPFDRNSFKLGSDEENLANAGSMIAAAIDRINGTGHKTKSGTFTAEEILTKSHLYGNDGTALWNKEEAIDAMEEYANQFKSLSPNREEGRELRKRIFYVDEIRKMIQIYDKGEMSLSKFVELLNEKATGLSAMQLHGLSPSSTPLEQKELKPLDLEEVLRLYNEHYGLRHECFDLELKGVELSFSFYEVDNLQNASINIDCMPIVCYRYLESKGYKI